MQEISQSQQNLQAFINSLAEFSFQQKYFKWLSFVRLLQEKQSQYYLAAMEKFVEHYPFNHTHWNELCEFYLKTGKGKAATLKMYQVALYKNPKCITLWQKYLGWLSKSISKSDPNYLKTQYEKATKIIGNHYKAAFIFQTYCAIETDTLKKYHTLKKSLVSPLQDIDQMYKVFIEFVQTLDSNWLNQLADEQKIQTNNDQNRNKNICEELKTIAKKLYQPTKQHVAIRSQYESKILIDQYQPYADSIENWRNYIQFIKNSGNTQFLPSIYERALITQCDNEALWEEYFLFLENEDNHNRALFLLRSHATLIGNLSRQLTYYWIQLEQRQDPVHARELYMQLEKNNLETFMRHIQLELRSKQFQNAKRIYQTILTVFTTNLSVVSFVVIQYAEFILKYFRDLTFSRKLIKDYFQSYPFDEYLFIGCLEFYIKHIEYKEGTKESKQIYDQFVNILVRGLKGAYENYPKQYARINKVANNLLRNYISSIYLLKSADRKVKELQLSLRKGINNEKRTYDEVSHDEPSVKKVKFNSQL